MKLIIDRFEGKFAVCEKEDRNMINIEKNKIPTESKAGDVLSVTENEIVIDEIDTINRKKDIEKMTKDLWN